MNKNLTFFIILVAVGLSIFLGIALGRFTLNKLSVETANSACAVTMTDIIASAQGDVYVIEGDTEFVEPQSYYLVTYSVEGDEIIEPFLEPVPNNLADEQKDIALQTEAWDVFTTIVPAQDRQMLVQYNVFTDGNSNTLAAVDQNLEDPSKWILEIDIADLADRDALLFTLIHEYAHLLTLNATQVIPDQEIVDDPMNVAMLEEKAAACPNYFAGTGCSYPNSYIHTFYNRFWVDINDEWKKIDALQYGEDDMLYFDGLYSFYKTHQDQFVDDYATTHPAEDIAESFTYFVFAPKPTGDSIKEQKIAFFYEYPELVQLRENILNGACSLKE
ncbi:MAG: hypothetical protein IPO22_17940 [Anaerolineales bacterium]|nr:hypothetical protein [Anaerolineales bacterium]